MTTLFHWIVLEIIANLSANMKRTKAKLIGQNARHRMELRFFAQTTPFRTKKSQLKSNRPTKKAVSLQPRMLRLKIIMTRHGTPMNDALEGRMRKISLARSRM